jgi:hypothetical protein
MARLHLRARQVLAAVGGERHDRPDHSGRRRSPERQWPARDKRAQVLSARVWITWGARATASAIAGEFQCIDAYEADA